ncbi:MAG: ferric reductase-like transmembrane domain-containing protein [Chloroflexota bacterium]
MLERLKLDQTRIITHLVLLLFSILGCLLTYLYAPNSSLSEVLTIGMGYVALLLLALTLLIGPLNLWRKRRNPVNLNLRRDVGIWSALTGLLHVLFSFQLPQDGDPLSYFFAKSPTGYAPPEPNLASLSNYTGLIATVIMLALLVTSNQLSLRYLKGKRWKLVQRFNYPLVVLVLIHTFGYQILNIRESIFAYSVIALSLLTGVVQLGGVLVMRRRMQQRQVTHATPVGTTSSVTPNLAPIPADLARRQFLTIAGGAILGGLTVGTVLGRTLLSDHHEDSDEAELPYSETTPSASSSNNQNGRSRGGSGAVGPNNPLQPTTLANGSNLASGQTTNTRSIVLSNTSKLAPGSAVKFTTPDTRESAFLVRQKDGSVKAYSSVCTHRPYALVFDGNQQALVCNLHNVPFEVKSGTPTRRPARTALKSFQVQIDGQGNIIYLQA